MGNLLLEAVSSSGNGSNICTAIEGALIVGAIALLYWAIRSFIKAKCENLEENGLRIEKKVNKIAAWAFRMDGRVVRIETKLNISPITGASPIRLTNIGLEILKNSGIKEAVEQYKDKLIEQIKKENPSSAYDVQEVTRLVLQSFDFDLITISKLKDYAFKSGKWNVPDIRDVGAIYLRDIALPMFGCKLEDLNNKSIPPKNP